MVPGKTSSTKIRTASLLRNDSKINYMVNIRNLYEGRQSNSNYIVRRPPRNRAAAATVKYGGRHSKVWRSPQHIV